MHTKTGLIVFTDLDGTLLDYSSYSFEEARPALGMLKKRGLPLVIVSSKTRAEIEPLMEILPMPSRLFIPENGSAVYLDRRLPIPPGLQAELRPGYRAVVPGRRYGEVLDALARAAGTCNARIRGFHDMSDREVAELTGLDLEAAGLARGREFSEPFVFQGGAEKLGCLKAELDRLGMNCLEGGRLFHALGRADKGLATRIVIDLFRTTRSDTRWETVSLGDGPNDLDMLRCTDVAVIVRRPDGAWMDYDPPAGQRVLRPSGIGPAGWNEAVTDLLGRY